MNFKQHNISDFEDHNNKTITNNESKNYEIQAIAIAIRLLGFWQKEGQYIVPNSIVDK